ncbi:MAG: N-acetylmuramoyl-L-alanine amidase, partial [Clostridia bacterium]|nr:N-acetylmuramoyl-L-alanine amidase [Clostridia bacterium]
MEIKKKLLSQSKYSLKCPYSMVPAGICVHNTSNDASAENEVAYMAGNDLATSFHYAVDDKEVIQAVPETRNAFHAGDGREGEGNREFIGLEICYSKSGGERFIQAEKNAAAFIALRLKEYGWDISRVRKHQDFSGKYCPHRTLDMGWQRFLDMINAELDKLGKEEEKMLNPYEGGVFRVTSVYGNRDIGSGNEFHSGLDLVGESSKKLIAIADGSITQSRIVSKSTGDLTWQWGNYVCLKADTGELIFYCHLSERLVSKGQRVKKGDVIGIEGSTGYSF